MCTRGLGITTPRLPAAGWGDQLLHSAAELPAALFEVGFAPYFAVSIVMAVLVANAKQLGLTKFEAWREGGSEVCCHVYAHGMLIMLTLHTQSGCS